MNHSRVVEQKHRPRLGQREAHTARAVGIENARFAALHALTIHQYHRNEIHAIAMCAFGRWATDTLVGVDTKLMRFDEPFRLPA